MSKFSCFFLATPQIKLKLELHIDEGPLIANHLDQSLWSTNQNYWAAVRCNLLHSLSEVHNCVASLTSHGKLHEFGAEKPISWAKPTHFEFFAIRCTLLHCLLEVSKLVLGVKKTLSSELKTMCLELKNSS